MSITHKICKGCLKDKSISEFNKNSQFGKGINSKCKLCVNQSAKDYYNKFPWIKKFYVIKERCKNSNNSHYKYYGGRGIKCQITSEELKRLWFRDKAYLMNYPTINRKDNDKNYTFDNCEYIEWGKNSSERNTRILSKPVLQFSLDGKFIKEWKSAIEASKHLNISNSLIGQVCKGDYKQGRGFIWRFKQHEINL